MLTIAITGGIGSGKSAVTDYLTEKGYTVIDADKMARELTAPGGKAMPYILEHFGSEYVSSDGGMNRVAMRDLVYKNPEAKKLLEEGTTKVVISDIEKIKEQAAARGDSLMFFDIPLLFEQHQEGNYDLVWVVTADRNLRLERIMKRDGISSDIADLIIDSQEDEAYKAAKAEVVIENNGTFDELYQLINNALKDADKK